MHSTTTALTLSLLALASASPVTVGRRQGPVLSRSNAFHLQVAVSDPSKDLYPSVDGSWLSTMHVGAARNLAVASGYSLLPSEYPPFYQSSRDGHTDIHNDLGTAYSWGLIVDAQDEFDDTYPTEHGAEINIGGGTEGLVVVNEGGDVRLGGPGGMPGQYAVCSRFVPIAGAHMTVVRYVYDGEVMPGSCAPVTFVPKCATLNELPEDSQWTHEFVQTVQCYQDAA